MAEANPFDVARALVEDRFDYAVAAFLGGSALSPQRTSSSGLDIVVIVEGAGAP
jgi:hypothetical protein